jgi:hypothetical protein
MLALLATASVFAPTGIAAGAHSHRGPPTLDPRLLYASYLGEGNHDPARAIAVDPAGHIYLAGVTSSLSFPVTAGALQARFPKQAEDVAYVTKLSPDGRRVLYSTFFGGTGRTEANAIAVDRRGDAFIGGVTNPEGIPTTEGALQPRGAGTTTGFVAKLAPNGRRLLYSTYLGGTEDRYGFAGVVNGIAIDSAGDAYVTGATESDSFPVTSGAAQTQAEIPVPSYLDPTAFVAKLDPSGSRLLYSTFLGGHAWDSGAAIAIDRSGNAYVTGETESLDFPVTPGALRAAKAKNEFGIGFVTKVNHRGTSFLYSTYLGGDGIDEPRAIAIDAAGNAHVVGRSSSADFPTTPDAVQGHHHGFQSAFVSTLSADGGSLLHSTRLGFESGARGVAIDPTGDTFVVGFQQKKESAIGRGHAFLAELSPTLSQVRFWTPLGGEHSSAAAIVIGPSGDLYVAGGSGRGLPKRNPISGSKLPPHVEYPSAFVERLRP